MRGFINFIREHEVVEFAAGFIIGGSVTKLVSSVVNDLLNPLIGILLGPAGNLKDNYWQVGKAQILYGSFLTTLLDFLMITLVVYLSIKVFRFDRLDKKKEPKETDSPSFSKKALVQKSVHKH